MKYCLIYKNHNGKLTRLPYKNKVFTSLSKAFQSGQRVKNKTKKNMKVATLNITELE